MPPTADAPNEAKLLALPGKGAFEQSAEWRERDRKLVRREPARLQAVAGLARQVVPWLALAVQKCPDRLSGGPHSRPVGCQMNAAASASESAAGPAGVLAARCAAMASRARAIRSSALAAAGAAGRFVATTCGLAARLPLRAAAGREVVRTAVLREIFDMFWVPTGAPLSALAPCHKRWCSGSGTCTGLPLQMAAHPL